MTVEHPTPDEGPYPLGQEPEGIEPRERRYQQAFPPLRTLEEYRTFAQETERQSAKAYEAAAARVIEVLTSQSGLIELDHTIPCVVVADIHGRRDMIRAALEHPTLNSAGQTKTVFELLTAGEIRLIFLGDAVHTELPDNWIELAPNGDERVVTQVSEAEIRDSLGCMKMILDLIHLFPKSVYFIKGNHDNHFHSERGVGRKVLPGQMVKQTLLMRQWLEHQPESYTLAGTWREMEDALPLSILLSSIHDDLPSFLISHALPRPILDQDKKEYRLEPDLLKQKSPQAWDAISGGRNTSTDRTEVRKVDRMARHLLVSLGFSDPAVMQPEVVWLVGHRNLPREMMYRTYLGPDDLAQVGDENALMYFKDQRLRARRYFCQFADQKRYLIAEVPTKRAFNPDQDIKEVF